MTHRPLTKKEIRILISQGSFAENWSDILVEEKFSPASVRNTCFEGKIKLGAFRGTIETENGFLKNCGIYNSNIRDCDISDNVYISEVRTMSNYTIEENVIIENVGSLVVNEESCFGNGTEIEVINEGGGRELPVFDRLSSQIAYLIVLYRHNNEFTGRLLDMIRNYSKSKRSNRGIISSGSRIMDTQVIRNVSVGGYASVSGTCLLEDGTIISNKEAPVFIGGGVIARKFIILSGSRVESGAMLDKSFVGQAVRIGKQYSAENSLFFANSEALHGEACSIFAGPFTVSHHKSTLMIASLFSFFNAGSGTNQSNHMYKLGPVHQGILDRGSKTGSFAYMLLPCKVGAFSVIMGKHFANFDTSDFPFSYISEEKGKSELTPAMNLFTVGTRRDSEKWATRDKRKDPEKLDLIHFHLFSPYIVGRIVNGINILNELIEKTPKTQDYINYKGINIHRLLLKTARKFYEMALKVYIGQEVVRKIEGINKNSTLDEIRNIFKITDTAGEGKWVDICGLYSPAGKIEELINSVNNATISSIPQLNEYLKDIYNNYDKYAWTWCVNLMSQKIGIEPESISGESLIGIIEDWKTNAVKLNNMILKDAEKEFDSISKLGYGIDGDEHTRELDFKAVRGEYDENKFVSGLKIEISDIEAKADKLMSLLQKYSIT